MPADTVLIGEVGLGGELRQVPQVARRLNEAARLGFARAIVPASTPDVPGIGLLRVAELHRRVRAAEAWPAKRPRSGVRSRVTAHVRDDPSRSLVPFRTRCGPIRARGSVSDTEVMLAQFRSDALHAALRLVAPGTPLREGIDRILQANMGALILIGDGPEVLAICSGGFLLDAEFTPQRLSELAKMDGA